MEELPSFGCRWCCKAALCVFFYPLPLFVAFTPEFILPSCVFYLYAPQPLGAIIKVKVGLNRFFFPTSLSHLDMIMCAF